MRRFSTRREFLASNALGVGGMALATLLQHPLRANPALAARESHPLDLQPRPSHFQPQAKAMISLFMHGGPSHVDLLDPKPELTQYSGTQYSGDVQFSFVKRASKTLFGSPWSFQPHGESGTEVSELLPCLAKIVDDICLVRSMHTGFNGHEVSIRFWHGGIPAVLGRPTLGAWVTYALGTENQNMPAYMVLTDPAGPPVDGVNNWTNGWMPPLFQGTVLRPKEPRILNLQPPAGQAGAWQQRNLALLEQLNRQHLQRHPEEADLEARIASYELAARMQVAATEALDISGESKSTLEMYGIDRPETREYGTRCLLARRLVERGVRFVQLFLGGQPWDNHNSIHKALPAICRKTDQPSAALVTDLKQRGLLDTTLVHWGGEIGRLPVTENHGDPRQAGRDHNGQGFSCWFAGGGIRPGMVFGATDPFGHRVIRDQVTPNDIQATVLHQLGLDHTRLTYRYNAREQRLTDQRKCRVIQEILAQPNV